jgi:hypothetical protein
MRIWQNWFRKLSVRGCEMVTDQGIQLVAYYCRGLQHLNIQVYTKEIIGYIECSCIDSCTIDMFQHGQRKHPL